VILAGVEMRELAIDEERLCGTGGSRPIEQQGAGSGHRDTGGPFAHAGKSEDALGQPAADASVSRLLVELLVGLAGRRHRSWAPSER
jgi:hypothetical protein